MTTDQALAICEKHYPRWVVYKKSKSFNGKHDVLAELNLVHAYLFKRAENVMCRSCRQKLVTRVFTWYENYKLNNKQPEMDLSRLTRSRLIEIAKDSNITLPRNVDKATLIKLINDRSKV